MNPVERAIRRVDAAQRRHTPTAFVFGVVKKFGDDNGGILVASLAHSAFVSLFPLLLVLVTVLGLVAAVNPTLRQDALNAAAQQFPVIGNQLASNVHELRRSSVIGLVVGLVTAIWGSTGLAQTGLFTMEQVWNLPGPARPGYWQRLARAILFLGVLGLGVVLARRLWPRSIVQPPLTDADRAVLAVQALQNQRREEQRVEVTFADQPPDGARNTPTTPDEIGPPGGERAGTDSA